MTPATPWERILKVYSYSGCNSVSEFARKIGLNRAENLYQIKRGNNRISLKLAETISVRYPRFSTGWLMTGESDPFADGAVPEFHTIPYYTDFSTNSTRNISDGVIPVSKNFFYGADYAAIIKSDWLEPRIPAGSLIFLKNSHRLIYGNHYYIELPTGDRLYRIVRKSDTGGFVRLASNNPAYDDIEIPEKEIAASYRIMGFIVTV